MAEKTETLKTRIITPEAILSYPHLVTPQANSNGKPKFSAALVFVAGTNLTALQTAAMAAGEAEYPGKAKDMFRKGTLRSPFRTDWEAKNYPEGSIFLNVRSEQRPGVVFGDLSEVPLDQIATVFYPGAIVKASLTAFAFDREGNKGVSFGLNNLQFIRDGERLDNRVAAEDEFTAELSDTPEELPEELQAFLG